MKLKFVFPMLAVVALLASCRPAQEIAYVRDAARDSAMSMAGEFSKGIQSNDILYIYVESQTPGATVSFNQETNKIVTSGNAVLNPGNGQVQGYLVNQNGEITFPVLGKIKVLGMTHADLAKYIEDRLKDEGHVLDPVVSVKLMNFRVCVLGDVARPGQLVVQGERLTIFEAISMVGDLTIYGQRQNVTVVREENGQRIIGNIDLTSKDVFNSPYYYLHQNDVVYVEPNKRRKANAERDPIVMSYISSATSIVSVVTSLIYQVIMTKYYQKQIERMENSK